MKKTYLWSIPLLLLGIALFSCNKDSSSTIEKEKLPLVSIFTAGNEIVDEPKINATMIIADNNQEIYNGNIGIEIRGASSQMFPKKSYGLETRDASNNDLSVVLFDMPEEEDWVLYAPYSDKSLIRNRLIYDLARDMGNYASRCEFTELSINNVDKGIYVFMEKLKRDKGRIDISKLEPDENSGEDLTGGYILKIDKTAGSNLGDGYNDQNSFTSAYEPLHATASQKIYFLYEYPDAEDITSEQKTYIATYIADFENSLNSADFTDPVNGYAKYINIESFIDFFLLNEVSNNIDAYRLSTFMYKDKNGKLAMGPIWDFNLAFGNVNYCGGDLTNVWAYKFNERCSDDQWQIPFWWERLLQDPAFVEQLKQRWNGLKNTTLSQTQIIEKINSYQTELEKGDAITKNFTTWPILGEWVWPNKYVGSSYDDELNYLKTWIQNRLIWMDGAINGLN